MKNWEKYKKNSMQSLINEENWKRLLITEERRGKWWKKSESEEDDDMTQ
jgi:hypothetical protein